MEFVIIFALLLLLLRLRRAHFSRRQSQRKFVECRVWMEKRRIQKSMEKIDQATPYIESFIEERNYSQEMS